MNISKKLKDMDHGEFLKKQIEKGSFDDLEEAEDEVNRQENEYHENKGKKWIFMIVGFFLIGIAGFFLTPSLYNLSNSSYDRSGIESICDELFGTVKIEDALTKEVVIIAYEYNTHEPRVFSKFSAA